MKRKYWYIIGGAAVLLLATGFSKRKRIETVLSSFIPSVEGFRSTPYWDVNAYRWGYGTPAPGPTGTITRQQAFADMLAYAFNDFDQLQPYIHRGLSPNQWAAYLSFSYNNGIGNAYNLVEDINQGNDAVLGDHWKEYIYSDGKINSDLIARRDKEFRLWLT